MQPLTNFYPNLKQPQNIVVTMHQKPDGDALGSTLGLYHFLIQLGHTVTVISPTNWASFLNWLPGIATVVDYEAQTEKCTQLVNAAQCIFCLDFNVLSRTKNMETLLLNAPGTRILIDHHQQPQTEVFGFGESDTTKSSTCEMVYDFICGYENGSTYINNDVATCLYTGMMTDTGSFRFASTSANVHRAVAFFKEQGLEHNKIHENIYDNFLENRLRFIGNVLLNRMEIFYEYNTALITIPQADLIKYDIKTGDTEGLVNYPLSIEGLKMAVIIIDRGEERKMSFRSKGLFDVNEFARKYFNGGGHKNASGGGSKQKNLQQIKADFLAALEENKETLSTYNF
jgi:bifunctional oligoribonuclease and PAP phosphatase NrnA